MGRPKEFGRREQEQIRIYLRKEAKEALKEIAEWEDNSVQRIVESEIEKFIEEFQANRHE
ncbi:hypothetical protein FZC84_21125 [Rossellomorea vietnamensis]|uniref:Uncharacterized protein n=1 Tax=Rossellomorea vietnamensis TaxID=218284 RepID=A0A5D4M2J1_9BACI|nr:hypothetical protein [Rossellomorea vietnamensis]TYR95697.1 hypothetical protein FZC84_21125 [Rossellomorea vietnamensis]